MVSCALSGLLICYSALLKYEISAILNLFGCQTELNQEKTLFSQKQFKMGKFQNFELSAEQRAQQEIRNKQRLVLRQQYWKNITDPKAHASGEGGHLVSDIIILVKT